MRKTEPPEIKKMNVCGFFEPNGPSRLSQSDALKQSGSDLHPGIALEWLERLA